MAFPNALRDIFGRYPLQTRTPLSRPGQPIQGMQGFPAPRPTLPGGTTPVPTTTTPPATTTPPGTIPASGNTPPVRAGGMVGTSFESQMLGTGYVPQAVRNELLAWAQATGAGGVYTRNMQRQYDTSGLSAEAKAILNKMYTQTPPAYNVAYLYPGTPEYVAAHTPTWTTAGTPENAAAVAYDKEHGIRPWGQAYAAQQAQAAAQNVTGANYDPVTYYSNLLNNGQSVITNPPAVGTISGHFVWDGNTWIDQVTGQPLTAASFTDAVMAPVPPGTTPPARA